MTTTPGDLVFTGCDNDYGNGTHSRYHSGPRFGRLLNVAGEEFTTEPGNVRVDCRLFVGDECELTADELRQLARDADAAARWLDEHGTEVSA